MLAVLCCGAGIRAEVMASDGSKGSIGAHGERRIIAELANVGQTYSTVVAVRFE